MLVFPIVFTNFTWYQVLVGFLIMHCCSGILLSFVAVLGHFVPQTSFPKLNSENKIENSWSEHQLEATIDFSPKSKLINWITGGLNTHVAHHLFPEICHCHYYEITQIIENYCSENNYPYKKESLGNALKSHFQYLKILGESKLK
jgi:linoleoyl-CoA desaturase